MSFSLGLGGFRVVTALCSFGTPMAHVKKVCFASADAFLVFLYGLDSFRRVLLVFGDICGRGGIEFGFGCHAMGRLDERW